MKILRSESILLFFCLLAFAKIAISNNDTVEEFRSVLVTEFSKTLFKNFEPKLVESGLSRTDSGIVISKLAKASASCVQDSLVLQAEEDSVDAMQLIASAKLALEGKAGDDFMEDISESEYRVKMQYCYREAYENAGI